MDRREWLESGDPAAMLEFLGQQASERKLRLFACACARTASWLKAIGALFTEDVASSDDVATAQAKALALRRSPAGSTTPLRFDIDSPNESYIEGIAGRNEEYADDPANWYLVPLSASWERRAANARSGLRYRRREGWIGFEEMELLSAMCEPQGREAARREVESVLHKFVSVADDEASDARDAEIRRPQIEQTRLVQAELLGEIFGDPFRSFEFDRDRLSPDAIAAAESIYHRRAYVELPYLSDALADAGFVPDEIVIHLCEPRQHVRGCWALDLILGRS